MKEYKEGSSILEFFDVDEPITISMLKHFYTKDYDGWIVELNQTNIEQDKYYLEGVYDGGQYDAEADTWTVIFSGDYAYISRWERDEVLGHGVSYYVWKGYLTFTVTIQRLP